MKRLLLLAAFLLAGCAHPFKSSTTICPEYRDLGCASAPECSMDRERGCQVCSCSNPSNPGDPTGRLPSAIPPDRR